MKFGGKNKKLKKFFLILTILAFWGIIFLPRLTYAEVSQEELIDLINQEREKFNLPPLKINYCLNQAALEKGLDIFYGGYFEHNSPSGKSPWDFIKEASYNYQYAGENLAIDFSNSEKLVQAWMKSGSHRSNILGSHFQDLGISVISGKFKGEETQIVVAMFGQEKEKFGFLGKIVKFSLALFGSGGDLVALFD